MMINVSERLAEMETSTDIGQQCISCGHTEAGEGYICGKCGSTDLHLFPLIECSACNGEGLTPNDGDVLSGRARRVCPACNGSGVNPYREVISNGN